MSSGEDGTRAILASALTLGTLAALCAGLVGLTQALTGERIEENRQRFLEESLAPVLEGIDHDGRLSESTITIPEPNPLPGNEDHTVYRVYADGHPIAAVFAIKAMDGYSGPIRLLVGLKADGTVNRVRVLEHRETPGLGDRIESSKTDWIEQFSGRSLGDPAVNRWEIRKDDGEFDQLSGASVTSRAVVQAVRETLLYFAAHRDTVFAPDPATGSPGNGNDEESRNQ